MPDTDVLAEHRALFLEHVNTTHEDALLLVGRILGDRRDATAARAVGIDTAGLDVELVGPGPDAGPDSAADVVRVAFAEAVTGPTAVPGALYGLVTLARERSGEAGTTSIEREMAARAGIRTMLTTVTRVEDVGPHLRQITFGGGDLDTFAPIGPDTFLYVLLPPPGRDALTIDRSFTWEAYAEMPDAERPVGAYYTVRRWRPDAAEVDCHFVLHGDAGPASAWAARARPGDPVALWGPRTSWEPPPATDHYLLVADETGLPAAAAALEHLAPTAPPVVVVAETAGPDDRPDLPTYPGVEVRWLDRGDAAPGTTTLLADEVATLAIEPAGLYAWGGAESHAVTAVRKLLRRERGCDREQVSMVGYWRHADHAATPGDDDAD